MVAQLHDRNQTRLQIFKLQMKPQVVPVSDLSLIKVTYQKILVSADMDPDIDPVQEIARVISELSNHDPHTSLLQTQTRFSTPIICDIEPDIIYPTSRKILISADLDPDIDPVKAINRLFSKPCNNYPHTSRLRIQTRFVTPLSCDLKPDITKPTSRKIIVSSDIGPDLSAGLDSGWVIDRVFRGPFIINSYCHDVEKVDEERKMSSKMWLRMA